MKKGYLFLGLFLLPFFATGVGTGYFIVSHFIESAEISNWEKTPARITSAYSGERSSGDDGTEHYITASYRYEYKGIKYKGSRVGIVDKGGLGLVYDNWEETLIEHKRNGEIFYCYVNPNNPEEAVLFPGPVWDWVFFLSIFTVTFGGVGVGGYWLMYYGAKAIKREEELKKQAPDRPWLWNEEWASGVISANTKAKAWFFWVFAIFWNAISSPVLFVFRDEWDKGNHLIIIGLLFPIVGFGLIIAACRSSIRWWKFGRVKLRLNTIPGVVGGKLSGQIELPVPISPEDGIKLTLNLFQTVRSGDSSTEKLLWQDTREQNDALFGGSVRTIPVDFVIPYGLEPTNEERKISWKLSVEADVPGVDFHKEFEVPVFVTSESSETMTEDSIPKNIISNKGSIEIKDNKLLLDTVSPGHIIISIPTALVRLPKLTWTLIGITIIWGGVVAAIFYSDAPILFPIVFGLFEFLFLLVLVDYLFSHEKLEVKEGVLSITKKQLFRKKTEEFFISDIDKFKIHNFGSSNVGTNYRSHYNVEIVLKSGSKQKQVIASNLGSRAIAQWVIKELEKALGL